MQRYLRSASAFGQRVFALVVLFVVLRLVAGVAIIAIDGGVARGFELTVICAVAVIVYVGVALAVRRWSPPRRTS